MNIVNAATLRNNFADAIEEVKKGKDYLLIAKRGKIVSALVEVEFLEDLLALANSKYLESIKKAREEYKKGQVLTHEEVFGEL